MHIEKLEYIVEVAKTGSISAAAQNLHLTLSAVSQSISNLEAELGVTLFTRSRTGAIPTTEGKIIIKKDFPKIRMEIRSEGSPFSQASKSFISKLQDELT